MRKLRDQRGWTQEILAGKLQVFGWDISRESLAKLESQSRRVPDGELLILAKFFGVKMDDLFPEKIEIAKLSPQFRVRLSLRLKKRSHR